MAFDSTTRGKLQRLVTACRNLLTDEFDEQLQSIYGVYAEDGRVLELDKLPNLDDDERITGALLRERIDHLQSGLIDSKTPLKEAVQRVLREQAFTVLNRFAALRMAEERELVLQCVGDGLNSKGFQVFENVASPDLGSQYARYCIFLGCLFDELSLDLGVLFDRYSPFGLLFPREPKLKEFLQLLNDPELKSLWREDETIGWIYQYFNDPAERKLMREAAAPRNSRELAVRNQFFTPRYVVQFLIDNTLGRLWYEMTKGRTELARCCRYLLRRPNEVFLGNPNVISSLDAAAPWVREVILAADFSRLPEDPTVGELSDFGLAIDGYAEMERRGRSWDDFIATFYNPQAGRSGENWAAMEGRRLRAVVRALRLSARRSAQRSIQRHRARFGRRDSARSLAGLASCVAESASRSLAGRNAASAAIHSAPAHQRPARDSSARPGVRLHALRALRLRFV